MDNNQMSSANHIIEHLKAIEVDLETIEYIIEGLGMSNQMLKQLMISTNDNEIGKIIDEIHDQGNNSQFN
jgi:hypothetical protein